MVQQTIDERESSANEIQEGSSKYQIFKFNLSPIFLCIFALLNANKNYKLRKLE
ncbi:13313_t:CDS:2 [Cetraspora pellucida]|uniref:13313_t:CDS:1 n=1 Tax=Cetraspora pellucida TaxID=1433469 RepID=A0ACA9KMH5_9GLOM|nr:13313_t:CDS:2 [Cetraspora pellucida]